MRCRRLAPTARKGTSRTCTRRYVPTRDVQKGYKETFSVKKRIRAVSCFSLQVTAHDVQCKFDSDSTPTGDVEMTLDVTSMALERRTLSVFMHCNAKYYTGIPGEALGSFERKVVVEAGESTRSEPTNAKRLNLSSKQNEWPEDCCWALQNPLPPPHAHLNTHVPPQGRWCGSRSKRRTTCGS